MTLDRAEARRIAFDTYPSLRDPHLRSGPEACNFGLIFEMGEMDAVELATQASDKFNVAPALYTTDEDGRDSYIGDDFGGVPEVLAVDLSEDSDPLRQLLRTTMDEHLAHPSPGDPQGNCYVIVDPCLDDHGRSTLPPWSPHGPLMQNVILAVIAGRTHELRPLRGGFTVKTLAEEIVSGEISSFCSVRQSPRCTPNDPREIFTMRNGNYVCFFRACALCYFDFIYKNYEYDSMDPIEYMESEFRETDIPDLPDVQP